MPDEARAEALIETVGLKKYFRVPAGFLHAVDDINLTIPKGKTLGVVGESGCGKSTLGRNILRLLEPTSGKVLYDGEDIVRYGKAEMKEMRKKMQIIFQDPYSSINPRMSVAEIIAEFMIVNHTCSSRVEAFNQAARLMDVVGLARRLANSYPHELDGGRRQRIGIARALSLNPRFIVCDEPVSALDVSIQAQILNLLMDIQRDKGLTYMFITHNLAVVKHISDEISVMYLGQCVEKSPTEDLFANPLHPYTQALLAAIPEPDIEMRTKQVKLLPGELTSPINPPAGCRFANRCEYRMERCVQESPKLEQRASGHLVACFLREAR
ncbi:ABC transporter ATP-binding protein [Synergistales bacterium]|nr:ABC transporter ATP-binding protein [Synergistales bacterium]